MSLANNNSRDPRTVRPRAEALGLDPRDLLDEAVAIVSANCAVKAGCTLKMFGGTIMCRQRNAQGPQKAKTVMFDLLEAAEGGATLTASQRAKDPKLAAPVKSSSEDLQWSAKTEAALEARNTSVPEEVGAQTVAQAIGCSRGELCDIGFSVDADSRTVRSYCGRLVCDGPSRVLASARLQVETALLTPLPAQD